LLPSDYAIAGSVQQTEFIKNPDHQHDHRQREKEPLFCGLGEINFTVFKMPHASLLTIFERPASFHSPVPPQTVHQKAGSSLKPSTCQKIVAIMTKRMLAINQIKIPTRKKSLGCR
jgi:hypothetical protein